MHTPIQDANLGKNVQIAKSFVSFFIKVCIFEEKTCKVCKIICNFAFNYATGIIKHTRATARSGTTSDAYAYSATGDVDAYA